MEETVEGTNVESAERVCAGALRSCAAAGTDANECPKANEHAAQSAGALFGLAYEWRPRGADMVYSALAWRFGL